jgi:ABC-type transport system substrate-binding protein
MEWDLPPPPQDLHRLIAAHDKRLIIAPPGRYYAAFPYYLVLNHYTGPMTNRLVRRAVAAAVDKQTIVQIAGGPRIGAVADQMVLPGSVGYLASLARSRVNGGAGDPGAAKALLARAGYPHGLAIKLLESTTEPGPRVAQALQASLNRGGFKVTLVRATQADYYGRYLLQPGTAKRDLWDLALPGWIPDWFGSNGRTMLQPLFTQAGLGSTNFGGYDDALTNRLVDSALKARTPATAATLWERANERLAHEVAAVPLVVVKSTIYLSSRVHGCNWFFWDASCDVTNIWLS